MNTSSPGWFKAVAMLALLWNLLGCFAFASDLRVEPEDLAKLPDAQRALYETRPFWAVAATAVAVIGGALGCLGLLLGKKWAYFLLLLSLAGILVQDFALFVLANGASVAEPAAVILQILVLLVGIGLVVLSLKGMARAWLT